MNTAVSLPIGALLLTHAIAFALGILYFWFLLRRPKS